jgi:hypothetical protein
MGTRKPDTAKVSGFSWFGYCTGVGAAAQKRFGQNTAVPILLSRWAHVPIVSQLPYGAG